ncbi:arsenic resistance protein [Paenibacillus eucommiae]|uniref:ACR3 family arsenite efflux pump ArsB n=1 Tax=Paenibacillus eucommiae TaxID=1355755 RepID=A0ABS4IV89_9BACL|nr:arsenic resistance protein [Paenibacillus eucommiae]MBP1991506.1 ACR3 family arsenite efflux pump ArsB [Paenibacillus eucommiae]
MMARDTLEQRQIPIYAGTLIVAAVVGIVWPTFSTSLGHITSLVIAILLFSMFTQIPFFRLKETLSNQRFIYALLVTNYAAVPLLVWLLTRFLPDQPPLLLGVMLVLLAPCIDYVIVFTHLGRGNEKLILISTPLLFITQMLFLPLYLWLFIGKQAVELIRFGPFIEAFIGLILVPLLLALGTQVWAAKSKIGERMLNGSAWLPVPFMALTLFVIVASQANRIYEYQGVIVQAIPVYVAFMVLMPFIASLLAKWSRLDVPAGRALVFSGGTRNSLVVLPFAFALPEPLSGLVAAVIVTQTIVELVGELIYIRVVPGYVIRDH